MPEVINQLNVLFAEQCFLFVFGKLLLLKFIVALLNLQQVSYLTIRYRVSYVVGFTLYEIEDCIYVDEEGTKFQKVLLCAISQPSISPSMWLPTFNKSNIRWQSEVCTMIILDFNVYCINKDLLEH